MTPRLLTAPPAHPPTPQHYVRAKFGGVQQAKLDILTDFFRHGFDGSGADNFFDAGSCVRRVAAARVSRRALTTSVPAQIDGRLTSAWNWCSRIERKPYYTLFLMCGFNGFDGEFKGGE